MSDNSERTKAPLASNERCPHGISLTANPPCHFCEHAREIERLTRERDTAREALRVSESYVRELSDFRLQAARLRAALGTALRCLQAALGPGFKVEPLPQDSPNETSGEPDWKEVRAHELRYIQGVLLNIRKQDGEGARESADDTLAWLRNRMTVGASEGATSQPTLAICYGCDCDQSASRVRRCMQERGELPHSSSEKASERWMCICCGTENDGTRCISCGCTACRTLPQNG